MGQLLVNACVQQLLAWAKVWSPMAADEERDAAWRALGLPLPFSAVEAEFWTTFHAGMPMPKVPLLLHAAMSRDGGAVREDFMLVLRHLGLGWSEHVLPADHLGAVCEILAVAVTRGEDVLLRELHQRYLAPWCAFAARVLREEDSPLQFLPERFAHAIEQTRLEGTVTC